MKKKHLQPRASQTPSNKKCNSCITIYIYIDPQIQDQPYAYVLLIKHGPINFMGPYGFLINAMVIKHVFITCFVAS
jgi:hypothetical protein